MKRDRNSFFGSSNFNMNAMGDMGMPNINAATSQFYAAQNVPMQLPNLFNNDANSSLISEIESRLSKLERSINRLDARLSKLEGTSFYTKEDYVAENNMYMV